jgi:superfamily II DNA or RNA helicase
VTATTDAEDSAVDSDRSNAPFPAPEIGQLVEVRKRQFVVADVSRSSLPPNPHDPSPPPPQHLVTLTSIEDDALGEEIQVIWEVEAGARVLERATLPTVGRFDDPEKLRAFLHAVRWGAVTDADFDALQAPFRAGIAIEDYQLDPVVRAIRTPRANLLIADDVGLGKTIEAGLVIHELLLRHRARSVLIVCPASLQLKWRDEMAEKFGLEFRIVDTSLLRELRRSRGIHTNPWTHFPRLISSIDWLKRDTPMRMMRDALPPMPGYPRRFDILVVDEAHNVAPTGSANYAVDSQRTRAIRHIAPHFEHRLFLTATPHNGFQESFVSLLELLDDQRFARGVPPDREQLATVMVRRMKDDIVDWNGRPRFAVRKILPIEVDYTDDEQRAHSLLAEYARRREEAAEGEGGQYATHFVLTLLKKRLFSSPPAFALTLDKHVTTLASGSEKAPSRQTLSILRRAVDEVDEEYADDDERESAEGEAVDTAGSLFDMLSERERTILDELASWAARAGSTPDSKAKALIEWLDRYIRPHGTWSDERVIVFTEYRATQNWLLEILAGAGFAEGGRVMTLYGGMATADRERIKAAFQAQPDESPVRILLATDAASEGIDLQNHCHLMIHAEIPWNPNRLEQRNGRIDRHGQPADEVLIHHFVGSGWEEKAGSAGRTTGDLAGDLEFLYRAALKVDRIRVDLGRVGPVIAQQLQDAMLRPGVSSLDTTAAEEQASAARQQLEIERDISERIGRLHDRLLQSRHHLEIEPENVERVVRTALDISGQPRLEPTTLPGVDERVFEMPHFVGTWARCTEGLAHPHTGHRRPITFEQTVTPGRDDVVLVHLEHRLVQMCLRALRAETWAHDGRLARVTAEFVPDSVLDTPGVVAHARLVVIGESRHRLHEEIITAGGLVRSGRFRRFDTREQLESALGSVIPRLPAVDILEQLVEFWPSIEEPVQAAVDARVRDRMQHLSHTLDRRRDREVEDMTQILTELSTTIESQLSDPKQMALFQVAENSWTDREQEQLRRNHDSLMRRMATIPTEIENEAAAIRRRYSTPQERTFPVALTFLIPESMAGRS